MGTTQFTMTFDLDELRSILRLLNRNVRKLKVELKHGGFINSHGQNVTELRLTRALALYRRGAQMVEDAGFQVVIPQERKPQPGGLNVS